MKRFVLITLCLMVTGCSGLLVRDHDTGMQKAGKVAVRSAYCILTLPVLCASEWAVMKDIKDDEQLLARYEPLRRPAGTAQLQPMGLEGRGEGQEAIGNTAAAETQSEVSSAEKRAEP